MHRSTYLVKGVSFRQVMAIDAAAEASHFSQSRHFYLAVDRLEFKMETLVDLLGVAGQNPNLPMVVCCSSRDQLDTLFSAVASLPFISLASLYSDLAETERSKALEKFRQAALRWNQRPAAQLQDEAQVADSEFRSYMIVVTDACLPFLALGEAPISARMLINYELPAKKETYMRRMTTCLAADGIVINMVVGGEVATLNNIEENSNLLIAEMPINPYPLDPRLFNYGGGILIGLLYIPKLDTGGNIVANSFNQCQYFISNAAQ